MRFGIGRVGAHADSDIDGGTDTSYATSVDESVWENLRVRVGAACEGEGDGVLAAAGNAPEEHVKRGGIGDEVFGEDGVEMAVGAGEGREML